MRVGCGGMEEEITLGHKKIWGSNKYVHDIDCGSSFMNVYQNLSDVIL